MDKTHLPTVLMIIGFIAISYNIYIIKTETNNDMEVKAKELKELGLDDYIVVEPSPIYKSIWAVLNIQFYLFIISLIYGKHKKTI